MSKWALLSNHGLTLLCLADRPEVTTREIATYLGMTERSVQRIIADLHLANYISKEKVGRRNRYEVNHKMPIAHPLKQDRTVSHLLAELAS